jgi:hypothetical protein
MLVVRKKNLCTQQGRLTVRKQRCCVMSGKMEDGGGWEGKGQYCTRPSTKGKEKGREENAGGNDLTDLID